MRGLLLFRTQKVLSRDIEARCQALATARERQLFNIPLSGDIQTPTLSSESPWDPAWQSSFVASFSLVTREKLIGEGFTRRPAFHPCDHAGPFEKKIQP